MFTLRYNHRARIMYHRVWVQAARLRGWPKWHDACGIYHLV